MKRIPSDQSYLILFTILTPDPRLERMRTNRTPVAFTFTSKSIGCSTVNILSAKQYINQEHETIPLD
jgi:hypothetical protein